MPDPESFAGETLATFAARLASAEPVPGGGSAAAVVGALAASLTAMVGRLSEGRAKYAEHGDLHGRAVAQADRLRGRFLGLADEDAAAYAAFAAVARLPRDSERARLARSTALRDAARRSAEVPLETARRCRELAAVVASLVGRSNAGAASDLLVAAALVKAAMEAAAANVRVNLIAADDEAFSAACRSELEELAAAVGRDVQLVREGASR